MKTPFALLLLASASLVACQSETLHEQGRAIARFEDKYLYASDLNGIVPEGTPPLDSAQRVDAFIDRWFRTQLLLNTAELNLTTEQQDVEQQLEEYRKSLLIHMYQEKFVQEKLDTSLTEEEMQAYYQANSDEFVLSFNAVRCLFVQVAKDIDELPEIKRLYRSTRQRDIDRLQELVPSVATRYTNFNDDWVSFSSVLQQLPSNIEDKADFLRNNRVVEAEDERFAYLVRVDQYRLVNDVAPYIFVRGNVKTILLNKRRLDLIDQMEKDLYFAAQRKGALEKL